MCLALLCMKSFPSVISVQTEPNAFTMSLILYVKPIEEKPKQVYLAFEFHVNLCLRGRRSKVKDSLSPFPFERGHAGYVNLSQPLDIA